METDSEPTDDETRREYTRFKEKTRFLVDESLGRIAARVLHAAGWNVVFAPDAGLQGRSDEDVFAFAWRENRVLLVQVQRRSANCRPRRVDFRGSKRGCMRIPYQEGRPPIWFNAVALVVSMTAGVVAFLPMALYTSPWDAVRFRVPDNQGNWWHLLIGAPFFLAFPMIWIHARSLFSERLSTPAGRGLIWFVVVLSIFGTILVTVPFLLHLGNLARMNEWRRISILGPSLGIIIASGSCF